MRQFAVLVVALIASPVASRSEGVIRQLQFVLGSANPLKAPLLYCEEPDIIRGQYLVVIEPGYSVEQHKETIGQPLADTDLVIFSPESSSESYCAFLDAALLNAVRADPGVTSVQCTFSPWAISDKRFRRWTDWWAGAEPPAPLLRCESPGRIPGQFWVDLEPGYAISDHMQTMGTALEGFDFDFQVTLKDVDAVRYFAKLEPDIVAKIRADLRVETVECDVRGSSGQRDVALQMFPSFGELPNPIENRNATAQAPLLDCNHPEKESPDQYRIILEPGYTVGEHKRKVGDFEDPAFKSPGGDDGQVYYAELEDTSLPLIRGDPRVMSLSCSRCCRSFPLDRWSCRGCAMSLFIEMERYQRQYEAWYEALLAKCRLRGRCTSGDLAGLSRSFWIEPIEIQR